MHCLFLRFDCKYVYLSPTGIQKAMHSYKLRERIQGFRLLRLKIIDYLLQISFSKVFDNSECIFDYLNKVCKHSESCVCVLDLCLGNAFRKFQLYLEFGLSV